MTPANKARSEIRERRKEKAFKMLQGQKTSQEMAAITGFSFVSIATYFNELCESGELIRKQINKSIYFAKPYHEFIAVPRKTKVRKQRKPKAEKTFKLNHWLTTSWV